MGQVRPNAGRALLALASNGLPGLALLSFAWVGCSGVIGELQSGSAVDGASLPATQTMHRLNNTEYRNTVRDLLFVDFDPSATFPADDVSLGFDNIAQVLTLSPLHFDLYEQAATALAQTALDPNQAARGQIATCSVSERACRDTLLTDFASRAWRRPTTTAEIAGLQGLVGVALTEGQSAEAGLELALRAVLLSPHFIYRPELDDDPDSPEPHPLNDYELASRLSYFLWSTMPDEELFAAAAAGELQNDARLAGEVERMLADPKAAALIENFAGQWLLLRALQDHEPDYQAFPTWDEALRDAMKTETELFFTEFLNGNAPMSDLLLADFTFLNAKLAAHYGIPFDGGDTLQRTSLAGSGERFGLLTHGSLLTTTSMPTRTSPVKRGVWVLEQLLCDRPPAPPPGVEGLTEDATAGGGSLRQQLERHRSDPICASCHARMDPIGLGLENYDAIGAFRSEDNGQPIDASGELQGAFTKPAELLEQLQTDHRFNPCIVEKFMTFALGREVGEEDEAYVAHIAQDFTAADTRLPALIKAIVLSQPFRMRRGTQVATSNPSSNAQP